MKKYHVGYLPYPNEIWGGSEIFECWAEDAEHAREQCSNAYPEANIFKVREIPTTKKFKVIFYYKVFQEVEIEAHTGEQAREKLLSGDFNTDDVRPYDTDPLLEADEIVSVEEV